MKAAQASIRERPALYAAYGFPWQKARGMCYDERDVVYHFRCCQGGCSSANRVDQQLRFIAGEDRRSSVCSVGEATHGTHEFYRERARITQRLIRKKGFQAIAVEAD